MARKLRLPYPGAMYHVMSRGDHLEAVFREAENGYASGWQWAPGKPSIEDSMNKNKPKVEMLGTDPFSTPLRNHQMLL
jgi:hypothetical protein